MVQMRAHDLLDPAAPTLVHRPSARPQHIMMKQKCRGGGSSSSSSSPVAGGPPPPAGGGKKQKQQPAPAPAARQHNQHTNHRNHLAVLEEHCARLKQQKRVAEKFATGALAEAEAARAQVAALTSELESERRRAQCCERMAEQRAAELIRLRREWDDSFQARVEDDVFRAVEATGDAQIFPYDLTPTLAAIQSKVGGAALQRRTARLQDPACHPLGLHPGVREWGTCGAPLTGLAFGL